MRQMLQKLRSKAGESLVESMAAILIFTLASVGLFTMVDASNNINRTAREKDAFLQSEMVEVEKADTSAEQGKAIFKIKNVRGHKVAQKSVDVNIYGNTADGLYSYFKK